jgi:hypothetical protein
VRRRLQGFDWDVSEVWRLLRTHFGETIQSNAIRSIADLLCHKVQGLGLDRDAQRDGRVLIKWCQANRPVIRGLFDLVELRDAPEGVISGLIRPDSMASVC